MGQFENLNFEKKEKYDSIIKLSFFRHGERELDNKKNDKEIGLTANGKKQEEEEY